MSFASINTATPLKKDTISFSLFSHEYYLLKLPNHPQRNAPIEEATAFYKDLPFYDKMLDRKGTKINLAPVVRLYGNDSSGVSICAHVHGYFPYFYIKMSCVSHLLEANPKFIEEFTELLEQSYYKIYTVSERQKWFMSNNTKIILTSQLVFRKDFYGYHGSPERFLKVYYYDPKTLRKLVDILESGVLYDTKFVVYEAHLTHFLRFYSDLDLCGLSEVSFQTYSIRSQGTQEICLFANKELVNNRYISNPLNRVSAQKKSSSSDVEIDVIYTQILNYIYASEERTEVDFENICRGLEHSNNLGRLKREISVEINKSLEEIWREEHAMARAAFKDKAPPPKMTTIIDYSNNIDAIFINDYSENDQTEEERLKSEENKLLLRRKYNNDIYWINQIHLNRGIYNQTKQHLAEYRSCDKSEELRGTGQVVNQDIQKNFHALIKAQKEYGHSAMIQRGKSYTQRKVQYYDQLRAGEAEELEFKQVAAGQTNESEEDNENQYEDGESDLSEVGEEEEDEDDEEDEGKIEEEETEQLPKLSASKNDGEDKMIGKSLSHPQKPPLTSAEPETKKKLKLEYEKSVIQPNNVQIWRKNYTAVKNNMVPEAQSILATCTVCSRYQRFCQCNQTSTVETPSPEIIDFFSHSSHSKLIGDSYSYSKSCPSFASISNCRSTNAYEHQYAYYEKYEDLFDHYNITKAIPRTFVTSQILAKSVIKTPPHKIYPVSIKNSLKLPSFYRIYLSEDYGDQPTALSGISESYTYSQPCPTFAEIKKQQHDRQQNKKQMASKDSFQIPQHSQSAENKMVDENDEANAIRALNFNPDITMLTFEVFSKSSPDMLPEPQTDTIEFFVYRIENYRRPSVNYQGIVLVDDMIKFEIEADRINYARKHLGLREDLFQKITILKNEEELLLEFIKLIHEKNIDIISGWDIEKKSLYYIAHRCWKQNIDIMDVLSRSPQNLANIRKVFSLADKGDTLMYEEHQSGSQINSCQSFKPENVVMQAIKASYRNTKQTGFFANFKLNFTINGRMILNVWRIVKHERRLNCYELESVVSALLNKRIALFSNWSLTKMYNHHDFKQRAYVYEYFMERIIYTVQIADNTQIINSSSSETKLYRFDFSSALSRGHQFRVESIMNRVTEQLGFKLMSASKLGVQLQKILTSSPLTLEPPKLFYPDPVVVLDFQSLYPSLMIAYNLCFSTCLGCIDEKFTKGRKRLGVQEECDFDFDSLFNSNDTNQSDPIEAAMSKIFVTPNRVAYVKKSVREGVLPQILHEFLFTRIYVKETMKKYQKDPQLKHIYDQLFQKQKSLKLFMCVIFGYTGATYSGRMPLGELADAIVSTGKFLLNQVIHLINATEKWNAKVIYGDTDSVFVNLKGASVEDAIRIGKEIEAEVSRQYPYPIKLQYEKTFREMVMVSKKKYVGYVVEGSNEEVAKFETKGLEMIRKDGCEVTRKFMRNCLEVLFKTRNLTGMKAYLCGQWSMLLNGQFIERELIMSRECKLEAYTSIIPPHAHVALRKTQRDRNTKPKYGERVKFLVVRKSDSLKLTDTAVSIEEYMASHRNDLNWNEYIDKQINPALSRVFSAFDIDVNEWLSNYRRNETRVAENPLSVFKNRSSAKNKNSSIGGAAKNAGIGQYYAKQVCIICYRKSEQAVCSQCCSDPITLRYILAQKRKLFLEKKEEVLQNCMQCAGTNLDFDNPFACQQYECDNFFIKARAEELCEAAIPTIDEYIGHIDNILDQF